MHHLRFRQIHLDFHTSPAIGNIGGKFDKEQYQQALKAGHVNSITTFAVGHHGWSYYDTKIGERHPNLSFDLLRAQFDACKEIDVNVPIYLTAGVHNRMAQLHPEWREINHNGRYSGWTPDIDQPGFHTLCFNSPYLDYLCTQIEEVVTLFPNCDGIFLDIISQAQCCCESCLKIFEDNGLDVGNEDDRQKVSQMGLQRYYERTTAAARVHDPDMPVFHNSGHIPRGNRERLTHFSHLELESLPTGGWGYDHFPTSARYCLNLPYDFLGMTGKFHTTWGEFGGYKHPNALRYECAQMLAHGAKCSVGDQLHPEAAMDPSTYAIVGAAYAEVEAKEPWCDYVEPVSDIAVLSSDAYHHAAGRHSRDAASDVGAGRVLLEEHLLFDLLDLDMDFQPYKLLILPDDIRVDDALKAKIDAYLAAGGKLLLTGESGLQADGEGFAWDLGCTWDGESPYQPDFALPVENLRVDFLNMPLVMYAKSQRITVTTGQSLGDVYDPYFNRNYRHFCSHQHAPAKPDPSGYATGVQNGSITYLAHPVFTLYRAYGSVAYRQYIAAVIRHALGAPTAEATLPSTARMTMMRQPKENRLVLHLLYANTISRGGKMNLSGGTVTRDSAALEVIEDLLPLNNVSVTVRSGVEIKSVTLEPQGKPIAFEQADGVVTLQVEELICHQMVVLHY